MTAVLRKRTLTADELAALKIRHQAAVNKLRDPNADRVGLLIAVVAPSPRLHAASLAKVRERRAGGQLELDFEMGEAA